MQNGCYSLRWILDSTQSAELKSSGRPCLSSPQLIYDGCIGFSYSLLIELALTSEYQDLINPNRISINKLLY